MYFLLVIIPLILLSFGILFLVVKFLKASKERDLLEMELMNLQRSNAGNKMERENYEKAIGDLKQTLQQERTEFENKIKDDARRFKADLEEIQVLNEKLERQKRVLEQDLLGAKKMMQNFDSGQKEVSAESKMWLSDFLRKPKNGTNQSS